MGFILYCIIHHCFVQAMLCGLDLCPSGSQWCTEAIELCNFELIMPMSGTEMQATLIKSEYLVWLMPSIDISELSRNSSVYGCAEDNVKGSPHVIKW